MYVKIEIRKFSFTLEVLEGGIYIQINSFEHWFGED